MDSQREEIHSPKSWEGEDTEILPILWGHLLGRDAQLSCPSSGAPKDSLYLATRKHSESDLLGFC